jgi:uncharacterized protein YaaQ
VDFKLIVALVSDDYTEKVIKTARQAGATGATVITSGRGEGLKASKTFFGLTFEGQIDMVLFTVEQHLCREILEKISTVGKFEQQSGSGIALQLNVEDAVGLGSQLGTISKEIEDKL